MKSATAGARRCLCALGLFSMVAAGVTGCAGTNEAGSTQSASGSRGASTGQSPTTTPTPSSEPARFGPATLVNGEVSCFISFGGTTTDADGTMHARHGAAQCTFTMNDPRVTGESSDTWLSDRWVGEQDRRVLIQWGSTVLKTPGGSWTGTYSGSWDGSDDYISYWYRGSGAYKGLTFHAWLMTGPTTPQEEAPWNRLVEGIIYPGEPPTFDQTKQ